MTAKALRFLVPILFPLAALAQTIGEGDGGGGSNLFNRSSGMSTLEDAEASPSPPPKPDKAKKGDDTAAAAQKPPTEITATKEATYDEKTRQAVFIGDVRVKDTEVTITCDKLTAFLRKEATDASSGAKPAPKSSPAAGGGRAGASPSPAAAGRGSGLERAIAEGHVVIIQEKAATDGGQPQRNVGKAQRADYNATTGDIVLSGMPEVSQGINTQIATSPETTMTMNRDNKVMKTRGPSKTVIQDSSQSPDSKSSPRP